MKKIIMKVGIIIMVFTSMITMSACSMINREIAKDVCDALAEKYGESFVAVRIGDRINTGSANLYIHPTDNENLLFSAKINRTTGVVEDNYIEEKVNYQIKDIVQKAFMAKGIQVYLRSLIITKNPLEVDNGDYTPESFSEKYNFDHYSIYLIIRDSDFTAKDILSVVKDMNDAIGVDLIIRGYIFEEDNYSACVEKMHIYPDISITMIEANSPESSFVMKVSDGESSILETELTKIIGRS